MSEDQHQAWNDELARKITGTVMLVGLTYADPEGDRIEQFYGEVVSADKKSGITLRLSGSRDGEAFRLPPDLRGVFPAEPGSYRLKSTGETVENPDFTTTWIIHPKRA